MKGQFVFEFLIAGLIFFAVVLYAMNYLSINVAEFRGNFYMDKLQSKTLQISSILNNEKSPYSIVESPHVFNATKINNFDVVYCGGPSGDVKLGQDFDLLERTDYGSRFRSVNITLTKEDGSPLLNCGDIIPGGTEKAETERFGVFNEDNSLVILKIVVW